jgi:hypothetical protein
MSSIEAPEITVVQPGGGQQGNLGTIGVSFKLWSRDTGGALSIVEHPFPAGALCLRTCTPVKTSTPSSPKARSGSDPATARSS